MMGTDYAEKEREFIAGLEADTGRSLEDWMGAITDACLAERNDIIDWLRQSGFTFANASWLERIHHNGGRLVYADDGAERSDVSPPVPQQIPSPPAIPAAPRLSVVASIVDDPLHSSSVQDVLAAAKGLRPLATLALKEICQAIPSTVIQAQTPLLQLSAPRPFLALLPGAKALRLYGDFGNAGNGRISPAEAVMKVAAKAPPPFPHVLVLADARLVDATFLGLVKAAHARAHI